METLFQLRNLEIVIVKTFEIPFHSVILMTYLVYKQETEIKRQLIIICYVNLYRFILLFCAMLIYNNLIDINMNF